MNQPQAKEAPPAVSAPPDRDHHLLPMPAPHRYKDYLGDSVYADFDGYHIVLTTENGFGPTNTIALEPEVLAALNRFSERIKNMHTPDPDLEQPP